MTKDNRQAVLVVDDTPLNIKVLNEILQHDYSVIFATNGKDALATATKRIPDVILLDIMMPDMDGYAVCARLKEDPALKNIPVIFVTALDRVESETRGLELGAVDYITKPFHPGIVKLRIKNQLELKQHRDMLAQLAMIDGLTGISNRRSFDEYLDREWRRALRTGDSIAMLMIDIDYFKNYNDTYGHTTGDECLKAVAGALETVLERPADLAARYGGEEFSLILPETDLKGAGIIAERIVSAIRALNILHEKSPVGSIVTVSIGIAVTLPDKEQSPMSLLETADRMLYDAKHKGRNRISSIDTL